MTRMVQAISDAAMEKAHQADAVLLGAVGGPQWDNVAYEARPEAGLLRLRADLELFANLRPAICFSALADASSPKARIGRRSGHSDCARTDRWGLFWVSRAALKIWVTASDAGSTRKSMRLMRLSALRVLVPIRHEAHQEAGARKNAM